MDKYIYDESNGLWYELQVDYYITCLILPTEKEHKPTGLWGQRHLRYLKEYRRTIYITLLTNGRLNGYLVNIDKQATDIMEWVRTMNNIRNRAEEIVYTNLIYH